MNKRTGPIKPEEIESEKISTIPNEVFEVINELIIQNFSSDSATIRQDDIVALLVSRGLKREEIFDKGWLDVEDVYRKAGWQVTYDKPGYNESYPATFTFKRRRK